MLKPMISADSHIVEPPNCYTDYIEPKFRSTAPRIEKNAKGVDVFQIEGLKNSIPLGLLAAAGVPRSELKAMRRKNFDELTRAAWDPALRPEIQDQDGVCAEVIYASVGMVLCSHPDFAYKSACMRAYNRWLQEFCAGAPDRVFGLAQTAVGSIDEAIEDMRRAKETGMVGMMMPGCPQHEDYDAPDYDALYECATDLGFPLAFHILTANDFTPEAAFRAPRGKNPAGFINIIRGIQDVMSVFIFGGVFDRHPKLKIVVAEADAGWVPHWMYRADHAVKHLPLGGTALEKMPSEYVLENVRFTFQDDVTAFRDPEIVPTLMWANDYPHTDACWPRSREIREEQSAHLSDEQRNAIFHDNVKALYSLPV